MSQFCNVEITNMSESINHNGIVERIEGDTVYVKIVQQSACSGCHAQSICSASEQKEKIIEITDSSGNYHVNEQVVICGTTSLGLQAVWLAFVLPLLIVLAAIIAGNINNWNETFSGLAGLILLSAYYYVLYRLREKLKKRFTFTLKKLN